MESTSTTITQEQSSPTISYPKTYRQVETIYNEKDSTGFCCSFTHLKSADYRNVYEPSEDSFLLIDALELDVLHIKDNINPLFILEVGVGSGVVINSLQMILKKQNIRECIYYGVDINQKALDATRRTAQANQCQINLLQMNFCDNMVQRMKGQFDILIFNPPYVVTPQDELIEAQQKQGIEASWAGGEDGIEVLMKFIPQSYELISENGAFYLLLIEENLRILKKIGKYFDIEYLVKRECPGERQIILRLTKKKQNL